MLTDDERFELALLTAIDEGPAALAYLLDPSYLRLDHAEVISREIKSAVDGRYWISINTPPQIGKTVTAIQWTALWLLARNPRHQLVVLSYNEDYAVRNGVAIRTLVETYGGLIGLQLRRGAKSAKEWAIEGGGEVYSAGLQGGITGHPATAILLDDYIKNREEADSARYRAKILANITTGALTRRSPGAPLIYTGTLWHHLEPSQVLIQRYGTREDGGLVKVLRLPAIADRSDDLLGRVVGDPIRRADQIRRHVLTRDESLAWWEEQKRGQHPRDWLAMFQALPPTDVAALLTLEQAERAIRDRGDTVMVRDILAVDPSDADSLDSDSSDATGIVHVGADGDGIVWCLGDYTMTGPIEQWSARVVELANTLDIDEIVYERNKGGRAVEQVIRSAWSDALRRDAVSGPCPMITDVTATKGKVTRASPVATQMINGEVVLARGAPGGVDTIVSQMTTYQAGSADSPDNMDAFVWGVTATYQPRDTPGYANVMRPGDYMRRGRRRR
jgi:predicted phage terminase large subunit-like protein